MLTSCCRHALMKLPLRLREIGAACSAFRESASVPIAGCVGARCVQSCVPHLLTEDGASVRVAARLIASSSGVPQRPTASPHRAAVQAARYSTSPQEEGEGGSPLSSALPIAAMVVSVAVANNLSQYPVNEWYTLGSLVYPVSFLVTDLTNRLSGVRQARRVVLGGSAREFALDGSQTPKSQSLTTRLPSFLLPSSFPFLSFPFLSFPFLPFPSLPFLAWRCAAGFAAGIPLSLLSGSPPRIVVASGSAFLSSQLLDVLLFDRMRHWKWWKVRGEQPG